jgi:hypothetical protein
MENKRRHDWKAAHGLRKFYKTRAEQVMKPINVELSMGHDIGISASYYKPTEQEILEDYLKAVEMLTINHDESTLQKRVSELIEGGKKENYIIKGKLSEKENEIDILRKQQGERDDALAALSDQVMKLMIEVQNLKKQE